MVTNNAANDPTGASGTILQGQGVGTASAFSTATYPATTTANQLLYSSATNTVAGLTVANTSLLRTSAAGAVSWGSNLAGDFTFTTGTAGTTRLVTVNNTNNSNTASNANFTIAQGGISGGYAGLVLEKGSTRSYAIGMTTGSGESLLVQTTNAAGVTPASGTNIMTLTNAGVVSFPAAGFTTNGSMYSAASGVLNTTAAGTTGQVLLATTSSAPSWGQVTLTTGVTGVLPIANGGTNANTMVNSTGIVKYDGSALVTSSTALIDASNIYTNTSQPCFLARLATSVTNVTGDGTAYTIIFDAEDLDQGAGFNPATGVYTFPKTGRYQINFGVVLLGIGVLHTSFNMQLVATSKTFTTISGNAATMASSAATLGQCFSAIVLATAGDTAVVRTTVSNSTKTVGVLGAAGAFTYFSGYLVC